MELLTNSGWRSSNDIESILIQIRFFLLYFFSTSSYRLAPKCKKVVPGLRATACTMKMKHGMLSIALRRTMDGM